jgi:hypothetical protein
MLYRRILGLCVMVALTLGVEGASAQDCFLFFYQGAGRANPYLGPSPTQPPVPPGGNPAAPLGAGSDRQYSAMYAASNPLGARAMYLWQGNKDTLFRIHGTVEPWTIGKSVSSGCIRMINQDVIDLYQRMPVGNKVVVLASRAG